MGLLVTGGAGFIGSHFVDLQLNQYESESIVVLDKFTYAADRENLATWEGDDRLTVIEGDIASPSDITAIFENYSIDAVVNFAAESHVDRSIVDSSPFIQTNVAGTVALLDATRIYQIEKFVQISTDEVYGSIGEGTFDELALLNPSSPYAASKAAADLMCVCYFTTHSIPVSIIRSSNNYGTRQYPEKLIPLMIQKIVAGELLPVYGDGKNVRQWTHVRDNIAAVDRVLRSGVPGRIYNAASTDHIPNIELVNLIIEIVENFESSYEPAISFVEDRLGHDFRYSINADRITTELNWDQQIKFRIGLEETVRWYLDRFTGDS
jgi:dTDP-glucose 4,6-dehydratase